MEANTAQFGSISLLLVVLAMLASTSADSGYGKPQLEGYMPPKTTTPKEHAAYENPNPVIPKGEHVAYEKTGPKLPTKPVMPKEKHGSYEKSNPKLPSKPVIPTHDQSLLPKVSKHPKNIAVQGLIYCIYGSKLIALQGATAKVTCLAVRKNGYGSTSFSFLSRPANEKGYFLAKIQSSKLLKDDTWEITECKAFLENSPWTSCKVPEDTNGGLTGARLTFSRHLNRDGYCLSSVGPFIYNPGHASSPNEGYQYHQNTIL